MNILARVVSVIFHPLLMATYLIGLLHFFFPAVLYPLSQGRQLIFLGFISMMTFVLPGLSILMLRTMGALSSFTMMDRKERIRPFFIITIIYVFFTSFFAINSGITQTDSIYKFLLIVDGLVVASMVITFFYKVSIHSIGVTGLLGILLPLNKITEENTLLLPTIGVIVVAGLVMSARLQLNSHTPREVLVGAITGLAIGFFGMTILF